MATGISGSGREEYLRKFIDIAVKNGFQIKPFSVGSMMFETARKLGMEIKEDKILDLSPSSLNFLRATVFEQIIREAEDHENIVISTHACFRWKKHVFQAFDFHYLNELSPDIFVTVSDSVLSIKQRLESSLQWKGRLTLKDILVWRDEEILLTKSIADYRGRPFYVIPSPSPGETLFNLAFKPDSKKAYLSYPITHLENKEASLASKDVFKEKLRRLGLTVFDPGEIEDAFLLEKLKELKDSGLNKLVIGGNGCEISIKEIEDVVEDLLDQIVARDYQLIDQSDFLIVYYFSPIMSPGVLSEMNYGFSNNKKVFVVFQGPESPFFTYYSTKIFKTEDELISFLKKEMLTARVD
ncbi:MAG: ATP-binding protein [Crenarchaeota archaeon]|nr:ATP-binding protein [Thermoproteota archaeon]MDW8034121.1 ATP-binding protein [Nitrososphaerota archaeon]